MIVERIRETDNFWTEGFDVTIPSPMEIEISKGSFLMQNGEVYVYDYPSFSFDVESDDIFDVAYDVYLLEEKNGIHIDRTEMGENNIPSYNGVPTLRYTLMTFIVPPNTTTLENIQITINKAVYKVEDTGEQQTN
jgi:hypothetical protein